MFRRLSQIAAVLLVLLVTCPVTAPFATFDLATETSPIHETFESSVKTFVATAVLAPFMLGFELVTSHHLPHAIFVLQEDDSSPLLTVLRL